METEQAVTKKDDFFDDDPPKLNGEVPFAPPEQEVKEEPEANKDGGDANAMDEAAGDNAQDQDAVAASSGETGDGEPPAAAQAEEEGAEPAAAANQEEPTDEGFQSTSPPPVSDVAPTPAEEDQTDGQTKDDDAEQQQQPEQEQEQAEEPPAPETDDQSAKDPSEHGDVQDGDKGGHDANEAEKEVEAEAERPESRPEGQGDTPVKVDENDEKPETDKCYDYDDSFSPESPRSLKSIDSTGKTMNTKIEQEQSEPAEPEEPVANGGEGLAVDRVSRTPTPCPASPSPSGDFRAEAGAVDPVVVEVEQEQKVEDGRSSVTEVKENEGDRGEDMNDISPPEGTEDSRGIGQWKSQEQQYIASAVLAHKTEQEALKEVQEERDKLIEDQQTLKIKDLQERLAVLARENEEKDQAIQRLNTELDKTNKKLKDTEHRLAVSEQERARAENQAAEAPKSKTCVVM